MYVSFQTLAEAYTVGTLGKYWFFTSYLEYFFLPNIWYKIHVLPKGRRRIVRSVNAEQGCSLNGSWCIAVTSVKIHIYDAKLIKSRLVK